MDKRCGFNMIIFFFLLITLQISGETAAAKGFWHTVKWGETVITIARKYSVNPYLLAGINNLTDWNQIFAGETLWIPRENTGKYTTYKVRKNDYLLAIAEKTGVSVWEIANANGIFNLDEIYPGQELIIPLQ